MNGCTKFMSMHHPRPEEDDYGEQGITKIMVQINKRRKRITA